MEWMGYHANYILDILAHLKNHIYGGGKSRVTVVCMKNNTIIIQ